MSYRIRICKNGATPLKVVLGVMLWMFCLSFPLLTHAAEEPGELTLVVKNQYTDRAVADVAITVVERATTNSQTLQTNAQGRVTFTALNPGLYAITMAKSGYTTLVESSVRVVTRKNIQLEFQLREQTVEVIEVRSV